jgi:hypothetical protein
MIPTFERKGKYFHRQIFSILIDGQGHFIFFFATFGGEKREGNEWRYPTTLPEVVTPGLHFFWKMK